jgi:hypothetical protein
MAFGSLSGRSWDGMFSHCSLSLGSSRKGGSLLCHIWAPRSQNTFNDHKVRSCIGGRAYMYGMSCYNAVYKLSFLINNEARVHWLRSGRCYRYSDTSLAPQPPAPPTSAPSRQRHTLHHPSRVAPSLWLNSYVPPLHDFPRRRNCVHAYNIRTHLHSAYNCLIAATLIYDILSFEVY